MLIDSYIDHAVAVIGEAVSGARVIRAYPGTARPIRPEKPIVAVMPERVVSAPIGLGDFARKATVSMSVGVFVPQKWGTARLTDIVGRITNLLTADSDATVVEVGAVKSDKESGTISITIVATGDVYTGEYYE